MASSHSLSLVPVESDFVTGKRKEQDIVEFDGSRRKKKKKQNGTPRPACSWVHFSREFIKEYSASHPESSGLKAATKAASEAWKSMSLEDKAKYTQRAREVWDDYLSSAPARAPKPRRQTKLVTRCSPGRLSNVLQRLTPEQKAAVKSTGFGSLLSLRCRTLRRSLCLWLLERFNTVRRSLEIGGARIPLFPRDVELVMGLAASGKDVVNAGPDEPILELRKKYNATNRGISVRLLEERLAAPEAGEDFKRSFVLYALGTLLCPTARLDVSPSFLHFLTNMDVIHQFNWGKFLLDRLVREITRFRQGKQRAVGGCLLFLQLFYYEIVAVGGSCNLAPIVSPSLVSWGEEEISEREKQEKELGGYGLGEVVCRDRGLGIGPTGRKLKLEMIIVEEHHLANKQDGYLVKDGQATCSTLVAEDILPLNFEERDVVCGEIELPVDTVREGFTEFGCDEPMDYVNKNGHENSCTYVPCACPIQDCTFVGSSEQLSLHFNCKHRDSGRRFQYNNVLNVSLGSDSDDKFLVLQAEDDGRLFLLNKGNESIGHTVTITRLGSSSSKEQFLYDLAVQQGTSSLRLKAYAQNFPGVVEGTPPMDFLLIPLRYVSASGQLNLEVCIYKPTEWGR